jgi:hypothetical protein
MPIVGDNMTDIAGFLALNKELQGTILKLCDWKTLARVARASHGLGDLVRAVQKMAESHLESELTSIHALQIGQIFPPYWISERFPEGFVAPEAWVVSFAAPDTTCPPLIYLFILEPCPPLLFHRMGYARIRDGPTYASSSGVLWQMLTTCMP